MQRRLDLLDALAYRASVARRTSFATAPALPARGTQRRSGAGEDATMSRHAALRLGAVGALSVTLGLWKPRDAWAQARGRGECIGLCQEEYDRALQRRLDACDEVFLPASAKAPPGWRRLSTLLRYGGLSFAWDITAVAFDAYCSRKAERDTRSSYARCVETCRTTCPPRRSLQAASSSAQQTCDYRPPPKPPPPQIPPPPPAASADGPCAYCSYYCSPCKAVDAGFICCVLPPEGGKSPCCPA